MDRGKLLIEERISNKIDGREVVIIVTWSLYSAAWYWKCPNNSVHCLFSCYVPTFGLCHLISMTTGAIRGVSVHSVWNALSIVAARGSHFLRTWIACNYGKRLISNIQWTWVTFVRCWTRGLLIKPWVPNTKVFIFIPSTLCSWNVKN